MEKKYFITALDVAEIMAHKDTVGDYIFMGMGSSKETAFKDALEQMSKDESDIFFTVECSEDLYKFMEQNGGYAASKNYFEDSDKDFFDILPHRDKLYEFAKKHNLSQEATQELQGFFDFGLNKNDDFE